MDVRVALVNVVGVVRKRIDQIRDRGGLVGEQNTKADLIDPILGALGWNLQEIDEVRHEYRRTPQDNPVDYALFLNRTECLFIEAKSLEKDLSEHKWITQNLNYAYDAGVKWCLLTNGDDYHIYNAQAQAPGAGAAEDRVFRKVKISGNESKLLTDTLLLMSKDMMSVSLLDEMWQAHFIDSKVRAALESSLADLDDGLVRFIQKKEGALTRADIRASLTRATVQIDFAVPSAATAGLQPETGHDNNATPLPEAGKETCETTAEPNLDNLIGSGLITPPLEVERDYKGVHLTAVVEKTGKVVFAGEAYDSLSTAAGMARKPVIGAPPGRSCPQTNGWTFWQYRDDKGELQELDQLRKRYLAKAERA